MRDSQLHLTTTTRFPVYEPQTAFDATSMRAFVASAREGSVKVVDMRNPTAPVRAGTLEVASNLASSCQEQAGSDS